MKFLEKNKKENNFQPTSKAEGIISNLINLAGVTIGIIVLSIGAVMFLESVFKLYIFDIKSDRYSSWEYRCEKYDIDSIMANRMLGMNDAISIAVERANKLRDGEIKKLTKEDKEFLNKKYKECLKEEKEKAEKNFQKKQKMDIAEGIAFMLVGFPLVFFYQRRRKSKK